MPGIWSHKWWPIMFTLVVNNFEVQYVGTEHVLYLKKTLTEHYKISKNWTGKYFCVLDTDRNYRNGKFRLSMKGYIKNVLERYQHAPPKKLQLSPHQHTEPTYGAKFQYAKDPDISDSLDKAGTKWVQGIVSVLLFYTLAFDIKPPLSTQHHCLAAGDDNTSHQTISLNAIGLRCHISK